MSITLTLSKSASVTGSSALAGSHSETGTNLAAIDTNFPAGSANVVSSAAFTTAALKAFILVASQPMTLTTNGTNEVQQIATTGTVTAGTFTLTYSGQTTTAIAWNAIASTVQAALVALSNIAVGDVTCTGGPLPATPVVVTFGGALGNANVAAITSTDTLTGGSTSLSTTTAGVAPGNTFSLQAGIPFAWGVSEGYYANPFTVDVVRFNVTCANSSRLQGKILT